MSMMFKSNFDTTIVGLAFGICSYLLIYVPFFPMIFVGPGFILKYLFGSILGSGLATLKGPIVVLVLLVLNCFIIISWLRRVKKLAEENKVIPKGKTIATFLFSSFSIHALIFFAYWTAWDLKVDEEEAIFGLGST